MNLQDFFQYQAACPLCHNSNLITYFNSKKNVITINKNKGNIIMPLRDITNNNWYPRPKYHANISFDLCGNNFVVDFDDPAGSYKEHVPVFLLENFNKWSDNTRTFIFYRSCEICYRYCYTSKIFSMDFKTSTYNLEIKSEYFGLSERLTDSYNLFRMYNYVDLDSTTIIYNKSHSEELIRTDCIGKIASQAPSGTLTVGLIPFSSSEKIINKLKTLITFS